MDGDGGVHRLASQLTRRGQVVVLLACTLGLASCSSPRGRSEDGHHSAGPGPSRARASASSEPVADNSASEAGSQSGIPAGAAWALVRLADGVTVRAVHPDALDVAVPPGSLMKLVTIAAALEAGVIDARTTLACARHLSVAGHALDCVHPEAGHPLSPAEALAYSCNSFLIQVGRRVTAAQLSSAAQALGLPPLERVEEHALAVVGLDSYRVAPRAWIGVLARLAPGRDAQGPFRPETRAVLRDGLIGAAEYGTASSIGASWHAIAKTGTAPMSSGGAQGVAVALTPSEAPVFGVVVVAPGAAGRDAASIAGEVFSEELRRSAPSPSLRVGVVTGTAYRVDTVDLEEYVARAVQGEAPPGASPVLLRTLAILARTFGLASRDRHAHEGFDVCDLTHCQVLRSPREAARSAARATAAQVLSWGGRFAQVFYTASCGGRSEAAAAVWPVDEVTWPAYLDGRPDPAAAPDIETTWTTELDALQVVTVLRGAGLRGDRFRSLAISERTPGGRAKTLVAEGFVPPVLGAEPFRIAAGRALGWQFVKSTWFEIRPSARGVRLTGRGLGHGVGLCVRGASAMARRGASPAEILGAYFPGAVVADSATVNAGSSASTLRPPSSKPGRTSGADALEIRLVLPTTDERERPRVTREVRDALDMVRARLGLSSSPSLIVRFHPTVASYQRATGRPWWTSATTQGHRIDLLPLSVLESNRQFERTLRHELVHVLTDEALATRAAWVREGLADYVAASSDRAGDTRAPGACPDDDAFRAARSAAALADLYARSASCVGIQLRQGRKWHGIR